MTPDAFASLAQAMGANVRAKAILDTVQFKVGGKTFVTLGWPAAGWAVVKVDPRDQARICALSPGLAPEPGRRRGAGIVLAQLSAIDDVVAALVLAEAWRHAHPRTHRAPAPGGRIGPGFVLTAA